LGLLQNKSCKIETTHCSNSCTQETTPKPKLIVEINKLMEPQHRSDQIDYFTHVVEIAKKKESK
jgi:hypothetical protein